MIILNFKHEEDFILIITEKVYYVIRYYYLCTDCSLIGILQQLEVDQSFNNNINSLGTLKISFFTLQY